MYIGTRDVKLIYLHQEAKAIKRQAGLSKKVSGLTRDVVESMLAAPDTTTSAGRRDLALMTLMYGTAARIGEILSLQVKNIHAEVKKPYVTVIGKGQTARTLSLLPLAAEHVKSYMSESHGDSLDPEAYLFFSKIGGQREEMTEPAIDKRLKMHAKKAHESNKRVPLDIHAHQFRHAKASHMIEDGINILQVSFLLGHKHLDTTMVYLDITTEDQSNAMATLESEKDKSAPKKWKDAGTLSEFCGLKKK
jgi:site-specific recombinase XerD